MKSTKIFLGILTALVLVAGGLYGIQNICACDGDAATTASATATKGDAKVEAANATSTTSADAHAACAAGAKEVNATGASCCAAKTANATAANATTANATGATCPHAMSANATAVNSTGGACCAAKTANATAASATAGAQCTYNAKSASVQCTGAEGAKVAAVMSGEETFATLAHCGIDCRKVDAAVLSEKLANGHCGAYTQAQWSTMIKSAQALDTKQADVIFANATAGKACPAEGCAISKVATEMAAAQTEEKKASSN